MGFGTGGPVVCGSVVVESGRGTGGHRKFDSGRPPAKKKTTVPNQCGASMPRGDSVPSHGLPSLGPTRKRQFSFFLEVVDPWPYDRRPEDAPMPDETPFELFIRGHARKLREGDVAPRSAVEWEARRKALRDRIVAAIGPV